MKAFHGCRIYSKGLQAKCDSLSYSFQDSVIRLYRLRYCGQMKISLRPTQWQYSQKTSRQTGWNYTHRHLLQARLIPSASIRSKGRSLTGYFKNNELYKIDIKGNGESIYYLLDGEKTCRCKPVKMCEY